MKIRPTLALLSILALAALSCAKTGSGASLSGRELTAHSLTHEGLERIYYIFAEPESPAPVPLVVSLHGGGGSGQQACALQGGIQELAQREGFLVACPDAVENHWNDGRGNERYRSQREDIDDAGFLLALINRLSADFDIDADRVFVTGASNGGMMSLRLACEASDVIAGAGVMIASLPAALECNPTQPVPLLLMNGTQDPLMPFDGGQVHFYRQRLGEVLSTEDTVHFWVAANGCELIPQVEELHDLDPDDGTRIERKTYPGCDGDSSVVLYTVEGGGHTIPGGAPYAPTFVVGKVSHDLHAGEAIWKFFAETP